MSKKIYGSRTELNSLSFRTETSYAAVTLKPAISAAAATFTLPNASTSDTLISRTSTDTGTNRLQNKELDSTNVAFKGAAFTVKFDPDNLSSDATVTFPNFAGSHEAVFLNSTQTLTNKTIAAGSNTISGLTHGSEVDNPTSGVHGVTGNVVGTTDNQTLTNKTIDASIIDVDVTTPTIFKDGTNELSLNIASIAGQHSLILPPMGSDRTLVTTDNSQTLENKTIATTGAGSNSITGTNGAAYFSGGALTSSTYLPVGNGGFGKLVDSTGLADGQVYSYDQVNDKFIATTISGGSGDTSFTIQSVTTTTITVGGGDGLKRAGTTYVTYDGAGTAAADFKEDVIYTPAGLGSSQDYILYIDTLGLSQYTISETGQVVKGVENTDFAYFTTATSVDENRYIKIAYFSTDGSSNIVTTAADKANEPQRQSNDWVNFKYYNTEDWQAATFVTNNTINVTQVSKYRRIGANMHGRMTLEWSGANTQASINIKPPSGFTIDETRLTDERTSVGQWIFRQASTGNYWSGGVFYSDSANVMFLPLSDGSGGTFDPSDGTEPVSIANGDYLSVEFNVPIEGWSDINDAIATPIENQQTRITSVNGTPGTGKHRYTFDSAFEDNRYNVYVLRNDSGTATFPIFGAVENQTSTYVDLDLSSYTVNSSNWVDVFVGRGPKTAVLPSTKWQQKTVTSHISASGSISALTFNNLEVGKTYEIYLATEVITEAADSDAFITVTHDGNNICFAGINDDSSISQPQGRFVGLTATKIFVATGTTVTFTANIAGTARILGSGSADITYAILKEHPNHEQTSQWT